MYELRDYQARAVDLGSSFLQRGKHQGGLIVLPTGAGKSLVIAGTAKKLDGPCLVFQPSKEILEQNATKMIAYGIEPAIYSASMGTKDVGDITLATIGSVRKDPDLFDRFPYVMVDEAHGVNADGGMYREFFDALGDIRILGLTATPYRLSSDSYGGSMLKFLTRTRPRVFQEVIAYAQIRDLVDRGYLVKPEYQMVHGFSRKEVALNSTASDFEETSLRRYYNRSNFHDRLRRVILRLLERGRRGILVFTRFVEDAEALVHDVPGLGVVSADTEPKRREAIIAGFRAGEIPVVANVGVLGIGFDYPELSTVVLARPTVSLALYYQQVGRVLRPYPLAASGDPQWLEPKWVVDMVDNVGTFGKIEDLWLQPSGATGQKWEVTTTIDGMPKVLTNRYFVDGGTNRVGKQRFRPKGKWGRK